MKSSNYSLDICPMLCFLCMFTHHYQMRETDLSKVHGKCRYPCRTCRRSWVHPWPAAEANIPPANRKNVQVPTCIPSSMHKLHSYIDTCSLPEQGGKNKFLCSSCSSLEDMSNMNTWINVDPLWHWPALLFACLCACASSSIGWHGRYPHMTS